MGDKDEHSIYLVTMLFRPHPSNKFLNSSVSIGLIFRHRDVESSTH